MGFDCIVRNRFLGRSKRVFWVFFTAILSACSGTEHSAIDNVSNSSKNIPQKIVADYFQSGVAEVLEGRDRQNIENSNLNREKFGKSTIYGAGVRQGDGSSQAHLGVVNLAIIMIGFQDEMKLPWTKEEVSKAFFDSDGSVRNYYKEVSFGKVDIQGGVYDQVQVPLSKDKACDHYEILEQAVRQSDSLIDFTFISGILILFPKACPAWEGMGSIGPMRVHSNENPEGKAVYVSWINGAANVISVASHEIGHNFGVMHANGYDCGGQALSTSCVSHEYGDPFDIMGIIEPGNLPLHMNAIHKEKLGFFDASNIVHVTESGRFEIEPMESFSTGIQVLKISRSDGTSYYLEYRQRRGFDRNLGSSDAYLKGVSIRIGSTELNGGDSHLIDTRADQDHLDFLDSPLTIGRAFYDADSALLVSVLRASSKSVVLDVEFNTAPPVKALDRPQPSIL